MNNKLSILQAYRTMIHFFDAIYFSTYDDGLNSSIGGSFIYSSNQGECPETMDPAYWEDWMDAVKVVMQDDSIDYDSIELTVEQSYTVMHQYLVTYCDVGSGLTMKRLRDLTNKDIKQSKLIQFLSGIWSKSLSIVMEQDPYKKGGLGFGEQTCLDERESFLTMQSFLDGVCKYNYDQGLVKLVRNSRLKNENDYWNPLPDVIEPRLWQVWQETINDVLLKNQDTTLNLLIAYKAMPLFLINYFNVKRSDFINTMILEFKIKGEFNSKKATYWGSWTSAAGEVNARQEVWVSGLISIKMQVSQTTALKIIKLWLQEYKELLGIDFIECVFSDELAVKLIAQQAIDNVKKNNRSCLLLDDEITILETYHIMLKLLEIHNKKIPEFEIDPTEVSIDINLMLNWIRICEQVIREKAN